MFSEPGQNVHLEVLAADLLLLGPAVGLLGLLQLHFGPLSIRGADKPLLAELGGCFFLPVLLLLLHLLELLSGSGRTS